MLYMYYSKKKPDSASAMHVLRVGRIMRVSLIIHLTCKNVHTVYKMHVHDATQCKHENRQRIESPVGGAVISRANSIYVPLAVDKLHVY